MNTAYLKRNCRAELMATVVALNGQQNNPVDSVQFKSIHLDMVMKSLRREYPEYASEFLSISRVLGGVEIELADSPHALLFKLAHGGELQ